MTFSWKDLNGKTDLSFLGIKKAFMGVVQKLDKAWDKMSSKETFHEIGKGALFVSLSPKEQVAVTWDGLGSIIFNIFTYDKKANHN